MGTQKKKEQTQLSAVFSISKDEFAETGVPGVTRLINPEVAKMKAEASKTHEPSVEPQLEVIESPKPQAKPATLVAEPRSTRTLADLGVDFALEFKMDRGEFRFSKFKMHGRSQMDPWQSEFYGKMVLNLKALEISENFHEFSANGRSFQKDAFGIDNGLFVQVVRSTTDPALITVLLSQKSLLNEQEAIRAILEAPAVNDDFKIELAS